MNQKESILIVDDDESIDRSLALIFNKKGYEVETTKTAQEGIEKVLRRSFNIALIDIQLPDRSGIELLKELKKINPKLVCLIITGHASIENAVNALELGALAYITKPLDMNDVLNKIKVAVDKQHLEQELIESEEKYRTLYESSIDGIIFSDMEGNFLDANQALLDMLGYRIEEIKKLTYQKITPKKWHEMEAVILKNQIMTKSYSEEYEKEYIKKDGTIFPISIRSWLLKDKQEKPLGIWNIIRDITERKRAEESLRTERQRLHNVLEVMPMMVCLLTSDYHVAFANRTFREKFGDSNGRHCYEYCFGKKEPCDFCESYEVLKTGKPHRWEVTSPDGATVIEAYDFPFTDVDGLSMILEINVDITERKQSELLLRLQRDLALAISSSHQLDEALSKCLETILQLSEMDCGGIYLINQTTSDLNLICHRNLSPAIIKSVSHFKADSSRARLALQKKPIFTRYCQFDLPLNEVRKTEGILAFAVLPLIYENRVIGSLNLGSRKLKDVSEINREILKSAASQIGEGITRLQIEKELKETNQKLQKTMHSTIQSIALILEKRDPYTAGHQERVTKLASAIAEEISLPKDKIEGLFIAGILHDIGKINIPTEILSKPGKLNEIEFSLIHTHSQIGSDILKKMDLPGEVSLIVLQHHERMDGSGYPSALSGEAILLEARILAVADVVEAMASHRPYRPALGLDQALEEITKNKGKLYDPKIVDACLKLFKEKGFCF